MDNLKAQWVSILFKLKPAIKNNIDKHKYQKTINSRKGFGDELTSGEIDNFVFIQTVKNVQRMGST